jgi:metallophosphoesterase (TIGR00282 family)
MNVLILADVVARPGRKVVLERIQDLREQYRIDVALMNAENVAGGFSITPSIADELFAAGIDLMTSGNHIFAKGEIVPYLKRNPRLLRPANYPPATPGSGLFVGEIRGFKTAVLNLLGRVFMPPVDDPFRVARECVKSIPDEVKIRLVDMHCEATSEKYAMGWFLDGKVSAVYGSHTHVQTADERILDGGTAYITDVGMTGSYAGVIGMNKEQVIERFIKIPARRAEHASGNVGRLAEEIAATYKFKQPVFVAEVDLQTLLQIKQQDVLYRPLPVFPAIVHDVSLLVKRNLTFAKIRQTIVEQNFELCRKVEFVDVYEGKGVSDDKRSITIRLEYRSNERTLIDEEIDAVHNQILKALESNLGVRRRV